MKTLNVLLETNNNVYKLVVDLDGNIVARDFDGCYDINITPCVVSQRVGVSRLGDTSMLDSLMSVIHFEIGKLNSEIDINASSTLRDLATNLHFTRLKEEQELQERLKEEQERREALKISIESYMASIRSVLQAKLNRVVPEFINAFRGYKILLEVTSTPTDTILHLDNINGILTDTPNAEEYDVTGTICIDRAYDYEWEVNIRGVGFKYIVHKDIVEFEHNVDIDYKSIESIRKSSLPLRKLEYIMLDDLDLYEIYEIYEYYEY